MPATTTDRHYLGRELDELITRNPHMWSFLQEASLDGVWYWDLEDRDNLWISPEYWRLLGIDPATREHRPEEFVKVVFEEDFHAVMESLERHFADPAVPYSEIVRFRHVDGSTVWVRCRGMAIRDESGRAIRMLGAHNDITDFKRAEDQALRSKEAAESAAEELRSFAYSVSHDIKAPTNTLRMLLEEVVQADDGSMNDDQRELLGMAQMTIGNMQAMIDDLLQYTRVIGEPPRFEPVDLDAPLESALGDLAGVIKETGAEIIRQPLATIKGHEPQLRALFQNLISNAIKYRRPGATPRVEIGCEADRASGRVAVTVTDNGQGIDPAYFDKIFKMFARLHRGDEIQGVGLGLSLCRRIAENHDGTISVESQPGEGSMFRVTLPAHGERT
ncbi:MAG: ATP-binding protein [Phycisphaerales bacterium]|jgi:PAS domain S-box-containing protein